jgi:hypothetical protein
VYITCQGIRPFVYRHLPLLCSDNLFIKSDVTPTYLVLLGMLFITYIKFIIYF